jgi:lipoic acid synthetase
VAHGRPLPLDADEPENLARAIAEMQLKFVVITSVDRDDLRDGGAAHFSACIQAVRRHTPATSIEVLVPDFRGRLDVALEALGAALPDVFNHNLETAPRLYKAARPGADYRHSLELLRRFRERHPGIPTKSGLMVGLGETNEEILEVMRNLRDHGCELLTIGQYLQPSRHHLPVLRFVTPAEFDDFAQAARAMGFRNVASGPMVRSSYHAEQQAAGHSF